MGGLLEYSVGGLGFRILNGQTRRLVHPGGPLTHGLIQEAQIELIGWVVFVRTGSFVITCVAVLLNFS